MDDNKTWRKQEEVFCTDCGKVTTQIFKGEWKTMPKKTALYSCLKCGCENDLEMEDNE